MFTQLSTRVAEGVTGTNLFDLSLSQALGTAPKQAKFDFATSKLGKVIQLAGFSDPVYAEAYVNVNQYVKIFNFIVIYEKNNFLGYCSGCFGRQSNRRYTAEFILGIINSG